MTTLSPTVLMELQKLSQESSRTRRPQTTSPDQTDNSSLQDMDSALPTMADMQDTKHVWTAGSSLEQLIDGWMQLSESNYLFGMKAGAMSNQMQLVFDVS